MKECIRCGNKFDFEDMISGTDMCESCFVDEVDECLGCTRGKENMCCDCDKYGDEWELG